MVGRGWNRVRLILTTSELSESQEVNLENSGSARPQDVIFGYSRSWGTRLNALIMSRNIIIVAFFLLAFCMAKSIKTKWHEILDLRLKNHDIFGREKILSMILVRMDVWFIRR